MNKREREGERETNREKERESDFVIQGQNMVYNTHNPLRVTS